MSLSTKFVIFFFYFKQYTVFYNNYLKLSIFSYLIDTISIRKKVNSRKFKILKPNFADLFFTLQNHVHYFFGHISFKNRMLNSFINIKKSGMNFKNAQNGSVNLFIIQVMMDKISKFQ